MELNVEPYTVEGIAKKEAESDVRLSQALRASITVPRTPEYYQYQLSGVVVHSGTADGGHYYSFIKVIFLFIIIIITIIHINILIYLGTCSITR